MSVTGAGVAPTPAQPAPKTSPEGRPGSEYGCRVETAGLNPVSTYAAALLTESRRVSHRLNGYQVVMVPVVKVTVPLKEVISILP